MGAKGPGITGLFTEMRNTERAEASRRDAISLGYAESELPIENLRQQSANTGLKIRKGI